METAIRVFLTSGYWVRLLVFLGVSAGIFYGHGLFWKRLLGRSWHPFALFGIGFVSMLAVTEAVGWPFIAFRLSAAWFTAVVTGVMLIPAGAGFLMAGRGRAAKGGQEKNGWIAAVVIALMVWMMLSCVAAQKANSDDSFYVSNVALFARAERMNPYDSSMGDITTQTVPMYDFQVWEGLMAVPCRIFGLTATETAHTLVIAPILLGSVSAMFSLGQALFRDSRKAWIFTGVLVLYTICCRNLTILPGSFLQRRTWQGKSVNISMVMPLLMAAVITLFREEDRNGYVLPLLCMLAGAALNPTSLYLNGFELAFLGASLAIGTRQGRKGLQLIPAVITIGVFTLMIYLRTSACPGKIESASEAEAGFFEDATRKFTEGNVRFQVMFLIALGALMLLGDRWAKLSLGLPFFLMVLTLWNPWTGRFVAEKITKVPTYWRVFWLLPTGPVMAWGAAEAITRLKQGWMKGLAAAAVCGLMIFGGAWDSEFVYAENVGNTAPVYVEMGDWLRERKVKTPVLAVQEAATVLRQEDTELWLLVAKRHYAEDVYIYFGREEEGNDRLRLFDFANRKLKAEELEGIDGLLQKYSVECVILLKNNKRGVQYLQEHGYTLEKKIGDYRVFRVEAQEQTVRGARAIPQDASQAAAK